MCMAVSVDGMVKSMDGVSLNAPTEISADWWQEQGPNSREGRVLTITHLIISQLPHYYIDELIGIMPYMVVTAPS